MPAAKYVLKSPSARQQFKSALRALSQAQWAEKPEQYCDYRLDGIVGAGWLRAKQFSNGTLYLEASSDALLADMTALLSQEPVPAKQSKLPGLTSINGGNVTSVKASTTIRGLLDIEGAYIGTDESGKGDYFGPLVIAGAYVDEKTCAELIQIGVMDSKKLTDAKIGVMYSKIVDVIGEESMNVVAIGPAKYNELYQRLKSNGKNLNHLLAWGHATVLETLLARFPDCTQAIADQFGDERYILSQLKEKGKGIKLYQTPKAEANIGVAAASVIARYQFIQKMRQLSNRFGVDLPFGANSIVKTRAKEVIARHGRESLGEVAKLHFKTTNEL